jgi:hypothetical protein
VTQPRRRSGAGGHLGITEQARSVPRSPRQQDKIRVGRKELSVALRRARKAGWTITLRGSGHLRWVSPAGAIVTTSATPSRSGVRSALMDLKRAGLS